MDAIVMLKDDHKAVEGLFKEFEKVKDSEPPAKKRKLIDQVIEELTVHAYIVGRNRLVELGEEMAKAKKDAPRDPLALRSAWDEVKE